MSKNIEYYNLNELDDLDELDNLNNLDELDDLDELDELDNLDDNEIKILDKYKMSFTAGIGCGKITDDYIRKLIQKLSQD